jgi:tetratricopeptide (TPR) repeat protein
MYRQALAIRKQLAADFPTVTDYREGLAVTLNNLGILLKDIDRAAEAEDMYRQALAIRKQLAADFPTVPDHQNNVACVMVNIARLLLARQEPHAARQLLEEAVSHHQAALKASPRDPAYRQYYRNNRWTMAETLLELKEHAAAATATRELLQAATNPPHDAYIAAGLLAGCVRLAGQDERLGESERQELAATYGDSAVAALRQAFEKRAEEAAQIPNDPSLDPLRSRSDFQRLLAEVAAKRKP